MPDGADRRTAAQVAADQAQLLRGLAEQLGRALSHELVRRTVEAVLANAVLLAPLGRDAVPGGIFGYGGVELGLEGGHERYARHRLLKRLDCVQVYRIVRRRGGQKLPHGGEQGVVHQEGAAIAVARVHGLECDGIYTGVAHADLRNRFPVIGDAFETAASQDAFRRHLENLVLK